MLGSEQFFFLEKGFENLVRFFWEFIRQLHVSWSEYSVTCRGKM